MNSVKTNPIQWRKATFLRHFVQIQIVLRVPLADLTWTTAWAVANRYCAAAQMKGVTLIYEIGPNYQHSCRRSNLKTGREPQAKKPQK